ncbi:MAG: hypothetical protein LBC76_03700 [Treponema sp.]|jgi:hypothetical protein|nr:hypothetical protein [Treponema sp.]
MSIKRFGVIGIILCAVLAFMALSRQCGQKEPEPEEAPEEPLTLKWSRGTLVMNVGETRDIEWASNKSIQPAVYSEGSAVAVTALYGNGVQIRAIAGGVDVLTAKLGALQSVCVITVNEEGYDEEFEIEVTDTETLAITVPYTKRYLNIGQETKITVYLENDGAGNEAQFRFTAESGKNSISVEGINNTAVVKALREGVQYIRVSHPLARDARIITFDILPSGPPPPPVIELSESPLLVAKGETKPLTMTVMNGKTTDNQNFSFQVAENGYAVEAKQRGNILDITGIAPGAALIRISNSAVSRDYELMVVVDSYDFN